MNKTTLDSITAADLKRFYSLSTHISRFAFSTIRLARNYVTSPIIIKPADYILLTSTIKPDDLSAFAQSYAKAISNPIKTTTLTHCCTPSEYDWIQKSAPTFPFGPVRYSGDGLIYFSLIFAIMDIRNGDFKNGIYFDRDLSADDDFSKPRPPFIRECHAMLPGGRIVKIPGGRKFDVAMV